MKDLLYWHKARVQNRYILELRISDASKNKKYPFGIKYSLIMVEVKSGKKVLMDNHHPKGPHYHLDEQEFDYLFVSQDKLFKDFERFVYELFGVKL